MKSQPARLIAVVAVLFVASSIVLLSTFSYPVSQIVANGAWVGTGAFLVTRGAGGVIGPILMTIGLGWNMALAADIGAESLVDSGYETAAGWLALIFTMVTIPLLWLIIPLLLLFPAGRSPSHRIRRLLQVTAAYTALVTIVQAFARPTLTDPTADGWPHPFLSDGLSNGVQAVTIGLAFPIILLQIVAAAIVITRMRNSDALERRQLAWVSVAVVVYVFVSVVNVFVNPLGSEDRANLLVDAIGFILLPLAIGVAIMRYRLYDIDVIISKSVTYLGLAAVITAVFAAVVAVPTLVIGESDGGGGPGLLLPIVATAIVAVLFEPIRSRMQRWANRLVYGERSTPHEVLSQLTARLSETGERGGIDDLARLLAEGTGAENAAVWLQAGDTLVREGVWPVNEAGIHSVVVEELVDDECSVATPVRHGEEVLGALSVTKPRNDPLTPADRELVVDVAGGAGLLLRNIGLNRQLEERAEQVRESRRRLIKAQDAERHRLERDLHDGAQQQVVALKVKLGLAKTIAARAGADDVATLVSGLADDTQHAVDALRTVAHGIYPPLLESEGLEAALRAVERSSPFPVELEAVDLERYGRSAEETVYFCVTETLERARMSGATSARVGVASRNGDLITEIDLARTETEVDLLAVADRLDAAGGTLTIKDRSDRGRHIVGSLPISQVGGTAS